MAEWRTEDKGYPYRGYLGLFGADEETTVERLSEADYVYWNTPKEILIDYVNNIPEGERYSVCVVRTR